MKLLLLSVTNTLPQSCTSVNKKFHSISYYDQTRLHAYMVSYIAIHTDPHDLQREARARPVPPVQPQDIWLVNPYMVIDKAAFES